MPPAGFEPALSPPEGDKAARSKTAPELAWRQVLIDLVYLLGHVLGTTAVSIARPASWRGIPSRKLRSAGPRLPGPDGAPYRTNGLDREGAVWWPSVCDGVPTSSGHPGVAGVRGRSPGRRRPSPGRRAGGPARRRHVRVTLRLNKQVESDP